MSVSSWRAVLLALCFVATVVNAICLFTDSIQASSALGFTVSRTADSAVVRVDTIDAGGAAQASGLRAGDLINVRNLAPGERYRLLTGVYPHEKIAFVVSRDGVTVPIEFVAGGPPVLRWDTLLFFFASFWMLGFAALIAWRRAGVPEARILCALLALYPLSSAFIPGTWIGPSPSLDVTAAAFGFALLWIQAALLATYASLVARPPSLGRRVLAALAYASAAAMAVFDIIRLVDIWNGSLPWVAQGVGPEWNMMYGAIPYVLPIVCGLAALTAASGVERTRVAYVLAPLMIFYAAEAMLYIVSAMSSSAQHGTALVVSYGFANIGVFIAPLGMTYALLNRRVLDIGFALNRVAIFSGVSIVVVGAFMLVEWALSSWLQEQSHTTSLVVGAAVALLLGFSIRFVHDRVEQVLDRV
ncbi:MAG TPA: PDZ domain-containing protein, partial [Candidatus Baltobacteraceae bacterium]|nr:PDZ domain-containing protein [Candidatus Baltobacteraceae bacterium]